MIKINSLEIFEATIRTLKDVQINTPAAFIHTTSFDDVSYDELLIETASKLYHKKITRKIIINGLSIEECRKMRLACSGSKVLLELLNKYKVRHNDILITESSKHTALECLSAIKLIEKNRWKNITVISLPHHITRVMMQWVECIKILNINLKVYAKTLDSIDWNKITTKFVLNGQNETGPLYKQITGEYHRIKTYGNKRGIGYTPNATPAELITYLNNRDYN